MSLDDDIAFLSAVPTFALLGHEPLRILAIGAESRFVRDGEVLFREGEAADAGYVVQEGALALSTQRARDETVTVGSGALLSELAMLTETVHRVTAVATESSSVLRIPRKLFLKMLEGYPDAARRLRDLIAERASQAVGEVASLAPALAGAVKIEE